MELVYEFSREGAPTRTFRVRLDERTLDQVREPPPPDAVLPEWTRLEFERCAGCPLSSDTTPHCPAALSVLPIVESFTGAASTDITDVRVAYRGREYQRRAPLQQGLSSLMGACMAVSGCPVLKALKPMVLSHLPFAAPEETTYRMISMYLFAQYFRDHRGLDSDWTMRGLVQILQDVHHVNVDFARRLRKVVIQDACLNAIVRLDCMADIAQIQVEVEALKDFELAFDAYF